MAVIAGNSVSAFGRHHDALKRMKVGDDIEATWERKGNYDRITSIGSGSGPAPSAASGNQTSVPSVKRDEFPTSMKVSYAKDLIIGNAAGTPKEAVAIVNDLIKEFTASTDGAPNPTIK